MEADLVLLQPAATQQIQWRTVGLRLFAALILAGLAGMIMYVSTAEMFFVYEAQIMGSNHIKPDAIYQVADVHEQNIFWLQPAQVAERISGLPGIKAASVRCELPARVLIKVEERTPTVLWRTKAQDRDWWLDKEGVVLPYHGVLTDTIFVVDSSDRLLQVGEKITPDDLVGSVQQLASGLPEVEVFFYHADRGLSFVQKTPRGEWPVYVGDSQDLDRKILVLQALTDQLLAEKIHPRYVDVRWADHPTYGKPGSRSGRGSN